MWLWKECFFFGQVAVKPGQLKNFKEKQREEYEYALEFRFGLKVCTRRKVKVGLHWTAELGKALTHVDGIFFFFMETTIPRWQLFGQEKPLVRRSCNKISQFQFWFKCCRRRWIKIPAKWQVNVVGNGDGHVMAMAESSGSGGLWSCWCWCHCCVLTFKCVCICQLL